MRATTVDDPRDFLRRTAELRAAQPVLTNMIGSVAGMVADGRRYDACWWWLVHDEDARVVGCAIRTAPWNLVVSDMAAGAARVLGRAVASADAHVPGVTGPEDVVGALLAGLDQGRGSTVRMTDLVYELDELVQPPAVPGAARRAKPEELHLLIAWHEQFARDAGVVSHDTETSVRARLAQGSLWLWVVDGEPVAMAGHAPPVDTPGGSVGRIGPVYTPQPLRGRGFGAAVTAAVTRELTARCATVMLFADAANPTSNGVYRRLGFRPVARLVEVGLH